MSQGRGIRLAHIGKGLGRGGGPNRGEPKLRLVTSSTFLKATGKQAVFGGLVGAIFTLIAMMVGIALRDQDGKVVTWPLCHVYAPFDMRGAVVLFCMLVMTLAFTLPYSLSGKYFAEIRKDTVRDLIGAISFICAGVAALLTAIASVSWFYQGASSGINPLGLAFALVILAIYPALIAGMNEFAFQLWRHEKANFFHRLSGVIGLIAFSILAFIGTAYWKYPSICET